MDKQNDRERLLLHQLEQEKIMSKHNLEQEKLKRIEEVYNHRLIYTAIIFMVVLILLVVELGDSSRTVQWIWTILYFGAAAVAVGLMTNRCNRDKEEIMKGK